MNFQIFFDFFQMITQIIISVNEAITEEIILSWGEYYSLQEIQSLELKVYIGMAIFATAFSYAFYIFTLDILNQIKLFLNKFRNKVSKD